MESVRKMVQSVPGKASQFWRLCENSNWRSKRGFNLKKISKVSLATRENVAYVLEVLDDVGNAAEVWSDLHAMTVPVRVKLGTTEVENSVQAVIRILADGADDHAEVRTVKLDTAVVNVVEQRTIRAFFPLGYLLCNWCRRSVVVQQSDLDHVSVVFAREAVWYFEYVC